VSTAPDPLEVLAFIEDFSSMPGDKFKTKYPEWHKLTVAARERLRRETDDGARGWAKSSAMVSSETDAVHHWVFRPLIQAALAGQAARIQGS
jgi:hypothetical protein